MKILITGGNGQLGCELRKILSGGVAEIGPIDPTYDAVQVVSTDVDELDITNGAEVMRFAQEQMFDLIINCAAMTNVDGCETAFEAAMAVNAQGPANLAAAAQATGAKLVQVSTDYVFAGTEERPRREDDATGPVSAYGKSKLEGERRALAACERTFVVRTAWLYGYEGANFVKTMLRLGSTRPRVTVVDDQLGNPTHANDLAYEILCIASTDNYGIYHCTNEGTCSWADFAQAIMELAGLECAVVRCTSEEYRKANPKSAVRPAYSSLENARLASTIGNEMRPWREALAAYFDHVREWGE